MKTLKEQKEARAVAKDLYFNLFKNVLDSIEQRSATALLTRLSTECLTKEQKSLIFEPDNADDTKEEDPVLES